MVYFMQCVDGGPIKVGFSRNVEKRRIELETYYGCSMAVLATMPGDRDREAEIHARFSHLRLGRTEQFRPTVDLMAFIGRPILVGANPDAVEAMSCKLKPMIIQFHGSQAFKEWFKELASLENRSSASLVIHVLKWYAKQIGFPYPPPER